MRVEEISIVGTSHTVHPFLDGIDTSRYAARRRQNPGDKARAIKDHRKHEVNIVIVTTRGT